MFINSPQEWDLTEKPRFTEEEVEAANAAETLYQTGLTGMVEREENNDLWICYDGRRFPFPSELFPSIRPGTSVRLSEIMGGDDG